MATLDGWEGTRAAGGALQAADGKQQERPMKLAILAATCVMAVVGAADAQTVKLTPQIWLGTLEPAGPNEEREALNKVAGLSTMGFRGKVLVLKKDRGPYAGQSAVVALPPADRSGDATLAGLTFPSLSEYQLVGAAGLGPLPEVDILGVHYIKVRPDRRDAFDKFVTDKLNPAVGNLRPDLRFLYYKGTAGPAAGSYITIIAVTRASRDKYWPNGSDSDDLKAAFTPAVKALATELQTYLVDGTFGTGMTAAVFESKEWADWMVVTGR
jgi:hypothetical protein